VEGAKYCGIFFIPLGSFILSSQVDESFMSFMKELYSQCSDFHWSEK